MTKVIGLISGTSVDGIDVALVDIAGKDEDIKLELVAGTTYPYPQALREEILAVCAGKPLSMAEFVELDDHIAQVFAEAAIAIQSGHGNAQLIGSHGQTVFHRPPKDDFGYQEIPNPNSQFPIPKSQMGYSLQLGRGARIAQLTGITTISNFRVADLAAGGEGAPLVPRVDAYLLSHPTEHRCIQNIGGIGNITYLPPREGNWLENVRGWDTGPGNALLDLAVQHLTKGNKSYDKDGDWAATGTPCIPLVEQWLQDDFFQQPPPKSTGRELFGVEYLQRCLADAEGYQLNAADLLASLSELTVASIVHSYRTFLPKLPDQVLLCGGGSRNLYLKERLKAYLTPGKCGVCDLGSNLDFGSAIPVLTTDEVGLSADYKEAIAFAVLGYWRYLGIPGNLIQVTGAQDTVLLGEIHVAQSLGASIDSCDRAEGNQGKV